MEGQKLYNYRKI